jgi:thiamine biosynthesis lipoprotein
MVHEHRFRSMNTNVSAWLWHADTSVAAPALCEVEQFFQAAHTRFTRFDPQSELCALNASQGQAFPASAQLFEAVELAAYYSAQTNGLFNPTIIGALEAAGYDRTFDELRPRSNLPETPSSSIKSMADVKLDRSRQTITLPMGVRLDLGGIAKGWAVQQAAQQLAKFGPCLVDAGGDIMTVGIVPGTAHWTIEIADPFDRAQDITSLRLRDRAVATSGIDRRRWQRGDTWQHHLIDPRTGQSSTSDLMSVTVIAPTTVEAEVYAKAVFVLGADAGLYLIETRPMLAACVITVDGDALISSSFQEYLDVLFTYAATPVI